MGASLILEGVTPLAYFKSRTLSFRCTGAKGNWYQFRHDEAVPVYVGLDFEAFKRHEDLIQCDEHGESLTAPTSKASPRSYRRVGSTPSMVVAPSDNQQSITTDVLKGRPSTSDSDIAEFEKKRQARLAKYEG